LSRVLTLLELIGPALQSTQNAPLPAVTSEPACDPWQAARDISDWIE